MKENGLVASAYRGLRALDALTAVAVALVTANNLREIDPGVSGWWSQALLSIQRQSFWWIFWLFLIGAGARLIRSYLRKPTLTGLLRELLDAFQSHVYSDESSEFVHEHRVTLFKHVRWNPWSPLAGKGWLRPMQRSGHVGRKTKKWWRAGDSPTELEGVAGQAWGKAGILVVQGLPDPESTTIPTERERLVKEYGNETKAESWARDRLSQRRKFPRSYCGIAVTVSGKPWGVLMLDSCNPKAKDREEIMATYNLFGSILGKILERG